MWAARWLGAALHAACAAARAGRRRPGAAGRRPAGGGGVGPGRRCAPGEAHLQHRLLEVTHATVDQLRRAAAGAGREVLSLHQGCAQASCGCVQGHARPCRPTCAARRLAAYASSCRGAPPMTRRSKPPRRSAASCSFREEGTAAGSAQTLLGPAGVSAAAGSGRPSVISAEAPTPAAAARRSTCRMESVLAWPLQCRADPTDSCGACTLQFVRRISICTGSSSEASPSRVSSVLRVRVTPSSCASLRRRLLIWAASAAPRLAVALQTTALTRFS